MLRAVHDFEMQMGVGTEECEKHSFWVGGDGATHAAIRQVQAYLSPIEANNFDTLRNFISTPEIWHA